jgi:glycosyltransferase involved in cell wall biosynthesis
MKILWFTNIPILSIELKDSDSHIGGWLDSMARNLLKRSDIQLAISFIFNKNVPPFIEAGVSFFPIYNKLLHGKAGTIIRKLYNTDENKTDIKKFLHAIELFQPDIIHIHGTEESYGRVIDMTTIPIVFSIQGIISVYKHMYFRGITCSDFKKNTSLREKLTRSAMHNKYSLFSRKAIREKEILGKSNYLIGRTDWDRRVCSILSPKSVYFHNDEVLRDPFYLHKWTYKTTDKLVIYTTTTNNAYKGLETIVETAILLKQKLGSFFVWKIGGLSNKDGMIRFCKRKYKDSFPSDNVIFLGPLNAAAIINEMLAANVYVMPSHIENSSNSLCEAMIIGMPIVATFAGGTNSMLDDGTEGILIQDGDPWSMAGAIIEITSSESLSISLGNSARSKALERHNPNKNVNDLISIYTKIISSKSHQE